LSASEDIRRAGERLHVLSARVLSIQEEERRRISRDLHDDIGQSLTALKFGLHRLVPLLQGEAAGILTECFGMADAALQRVKQIAHDMRPPALDELGLEEALRWLVERHQATTGLVVRCHFNGLLNRRFSEAMESACYRIAQEALSNATRHANAQSVLVSAEASSRMLRLTVRDDGKGFDPAASRDLLRPVSLGLIGMEERAILAGGRLTIDSDAGQGTIVRADFALEPMQ
jgi:signal transduction histidine kinase